MNREIGLKSLNDESGCSKVGVFTPGNASFLITDDLQVKPNLVGSSVELLNNLGIEDTTVLEEKTFTLGLKEVISLLMWSLVSNTPLSDVILHNKPLKSETFCSALFQTNKLKPTGGRKMALKVMLHKTTKKLLFAEAEDDFVDFLFCLPIIPLGNVVKLLCENTTLGGIVNLWRSISDLNTDKYFKSSKVQSMLKSPDLPSQYKLKNQVLPIYGRRLFDAFYYVKFYESKELKDFLCYKEDPSDYVGINVSLDHPNDYRAGFIRGPAMFMVTDDLEVTPLSSISTIIFFNRSGISLGDVEEMVLDIGTEEALSILRASLISSSALSNGLNLMTAKQPKQEK